MWIFVRNIPIVTTRKELYQFIDSSLRPGWLGVSLTAEPKIRHCEIICITDEDTRAVDHHGLIQVDSAQTGQKVIKRLNGRKLRGRPVRVRRYFYRSEQRDRRASTKITVSERRQIERRRPHLRIERIDSVHTEAMESFRQIHD